MQIQNTSTSECVEPISRRRRPLGYFPSCLQSVALGQLYSTASSRSLTGLRAAEPLVLQPASKDGKLPPIKQLVQVERETFYLPDNQKLTYPHSSLLIRYPKIAPCQERHGR